MINIIIIIIAVDERRGLRDKIIPSENSFPFDEDDDGDDE